MSDIFGYPAQPGRNGYVVLKAMRPDRYTVLRACPFCRERSVVQVPAQGLWDMEHGTHIQEAMPDLTAEQREQVLTGIHPACWDAAFPDEDDDDE